MNALIPPVAPTAAAAFTASVVALEADGRVDIAAGQNDGLLVTILRHAE